MARPAKKDEDKREKYLPTPRVTAEEYARLSAKAEETGLSLSAFVRAACEDAVVISRKPVADLPLIKRLDQNAVELNAIGNNINQMARHAHIHGEIDTNLLAQMQDALQEQLVRLDTYLEALES